MIKTKCKFLVMLIALVTSRLCFSSISETMNNLIQTFATNWESICQSFESNYKDYQPSNYTLDIRLDKNNTDDIHKTYEITLIEDTKQQPFCVYRVQCPQFSEDNFIRLGDTYECWFKINNKYSKRPSVYNTSELLRDFKPKGANIIILDQGKKKS